MISAIILFILFLDQLSKYLITKAIPLNKSLREPGTWIFVIFLGLIYLAHYLLMYVPIVNEILATYGLNFYLIPLTAYDWMICILLSLPAIIGVELYKWRFRKRDIDL